MARTAASAAKSTTSTRKVTAKATPTKRATFGTKVVKKVSGKIEFPKATRTSTRTSPYNESITSIMDGSLPFVVFEGVESEEEFKSFANTLRNLARTNHNHSVQVVWVQQDQPNNPAGVYVRDGGPIKTRETKPTTKSTTRSTRKSA